VRSEGLGREEPLGLRGRRPQQGAMERGLRITINLEGAEGEILPIGEALCSAIELDKINFYARKSLGSSSSERQ